MLKNVNGEYEKSIALASKQLIADDAAKDIKSKLQYATALTAQASFMEQNKDKGDWFTGKQTLLPKYMTFSQNMEFGYSMQTMDATGLRREAAKAYKEAQELQKLKAQTEASMGQSDSYSGRGGGAFAAATAAKSTTTTAAGINGSPLITDGKGKKDKGGNSIAGGITGGGPRVININGVKFADKIELHATSGDAALNMAEEKFQEMYLRVLNSGASVQ
jgi:hypothetical protein